MSGVPDIASDAVLVQSEEMPQGSQIVKVFFFFKKYRMPHEGILKLVLIGDHKVLQSYLHLKSQVF